MAPERRSWDTETMEAETLMAQCNPQWKTLGKQIGNHWVQPNPSHHAWFRLKGTKVRIQKLRSKTVAVLGKSQCATRVFFLREVRRYQLYRIRDWGDHILLLHALILKLLPFGHPILQVLLYHKRNKLHWLWTFFLWPSGKQEKININLIETRWYIQKSSEIDQISLAIKHATSKGVNAIQKCDLTHPLKPSWCTCGTWSCTWNSPTVLNIEIDVGSGYVEV